MDQAIVMRIGLFGGDKDDLPAAQKIGRGARLQAAWKFLLLRALWVALKPTTVGREFGNGHCVSQDISRPERAKAYFVPVDKDLRFDRGHTGVLRKY
jgi:hypothetical protein